MNRSYRSVTRRRMPVPSYAQIHSDSGAMLPYPIGSNYPVVDKATNSARYCEVVCNPLKENLQARIPDTCAAPTAAFSCINDFNFSLNANGVGGVQIRLYDCPTYTLESSTSTDATFAYVTAPTTSNFTGWSSITSDYAGVRLVAAGLSVEFTGNDTNNGGIVYAAYRNKLKSAGLTSVAGITGSQEFFAGPAKYGAWARSKKVDNTEDEYFVPLNANLVPVNTNGNFTVHVSGGTANAVYKVRLIAHYEAIPLDQVNEGSISDVCAVGGVDMDAMNFVAEHRMTTSSAGGGAPGKTPAEVLSMEGNNALRGWSERVAESINLKQLLMSIATGTIGGGLLYGYLRSGHASGGVRRPAPSGGEPPFKKSKYSNPFTYGP